MTEKKKWTDDENSALLRETRRHTTLQAAFMAYAVTSGRTPVAVRQHYDKIRPKDTMPMSQESPAEEQENSKGKPWTPEEDAILTRYVKAGVTNLKACFLAVAEQIGRTPTGVASHWYAVLSKKDPLFATISETHVAKNRKNGKGVPSTPSIWRRVLMVLRSLHI